MELSRVLLAFVLLSPAALPAQIQLHTFSSTADGSEQPYALYLPSGFDPTQKYALLVSLHTEDSNERLNLRQVLGPPNRLGRPEREDRRFIIACPYARGSMGYRGLAEQDVYDMIGAVERSFPVDPDRVYLTGASMGGGGALWLAETQPDRWAAVAPVCAATVPGSEELARNLENLPVRFYHGEQDTIVPAESSREWQRRLLDIGVPASYVEYPNLRHNAWELAYRPGSLFDWLSKFRRNLSPDHVHFATRSYRYSAAYWVRIDGLTPGTLAEIDARRAGNRINIETKNTDGFTLLGAQSVAAVTVNGSTVRLTTARAPKPPALSFVKTGGGWKLGRYQPSGKHAGAEGPIAEAVSRRPIYIYGSLGTRTATELEDRKKTAEQAATWSTPRDRVDVKLPVKADSEVTDADLAGSDLVLFGTATTNSVIAKLAPSLPLELDAGAADYGLLFIAPAGKHYALVSSGLPWWTGAADAARPVYRFASEPLALLATFGDYVLFKGSLAHVVIEGRFDRNWKVPADAAARMVATGTVTLK